MEDLDNGLTTAKEVCQATGLKKQDVYRYLHQYRQGGKAPLEGWGQSKRSEEKEVTVEEKTQLQILQGSLTQALKREKDAIEYAATMKQQMEAMEKAVPKLPPLKPFKLFLGNKKWDEEEQVLQVGDWHGYEVVDYGEMRGFNEFNYEIMCNRAWMLVEKALMFADRERKMCELKKLHVSLLGDMVSGDIHSELAKTNEGTAFEAVLAIGTVLAQAIAKLAQEYDEVEITGVVGNHGRMTKKPAYKRRVFDNLDNMVYQFAKTQLASLIDQGRVSFNVPPSIDCVVERMGWLTLIEHGDENRSNGGMPYYGFDRSDANIRKMNRKQMGDPETETSTHHIREMGHFHQYGILDGPLVMNMALIGPNEYSMNKLKKSCPPGQITYFLNEAKGIVGWHPIWLRDADTHEWAINPELIYHAETLDAA